MMNKKGIAVFISVYLVLAVVLFFYKGYQAAPGLIAEEANTPPKTDVVTEIPPVVKEYGVSAGNPLAVEIGMQILESGGNAADAAVAISYALGVLQPYGTGIGGGGAMLVYPSDGSPPVFYDYLETSPVNGSRPKGYAGLPGFVLGMERINADLGSMDMGTLIEPSVLIAENGFRIDSTLSKMIGISANKLPKSKFENYYAEGSLISTGMTLKQIALGETLRKIQTGGAGIFYKGSIAADIIARTGGFTAADFTDYQVIKREPVTGEYEGFGIVSAPPPFSGITLIQILEMSEKLETENFETDPQDLVLLSNIINAAYMTRYKNIADPAYTDVDYAEMLSTAALDKMLVGIDTKVSEPPDESEDTTHFVVVDKDGMMVSCTNSLSSWFGSGIYVDGFFLNNHLKNFNPNENNVNGWEAGKRPHTFISPTIITRDGKPVMAIGSPGGGRIPTVLAQVMIKVLKNQENPQEAIDDPRFYVVGKDFYYENSFSGNSLKRLAELNYRLVNNPSAIAYGAVNCLYFDVATNKIYGGADSRRGGAWETGQDK